MTYRLSMPIYHSNDIKMPIIKQLMKEVFGYTDEEVCQFVKNDFMTSVVKNISIDEAKLIIKPFYDNDISIYLEDSSGHFLGYIEAGIIINKEQPKKHYYDKPIVSRDKLVNPYTIKKQEREENIFKNDAILAEQRRQANTKPVVTCPYCQSTNTSKISVLSKAAHTTLFGLFSISRNAKQWHCNNCKSDF